MDPHSAHLASVQAVETVVERLVQAIASEDWEAAGRSDQALADALVRLDSELADVDMRERQAIIERLQPVCALHAEAMASVVAERERLRNELADISKGRQAVGLYAQSAGL